jgi:hypothetical protein
MRHKWKPYSLPWELLETAYKGEQCEKCGCIKLHVKNGPVYYSRYLKNGSWSDNRPDCVENRSIEKSTNV